MRSQVEHVNIAVTDVDESVRFFETAMPDFKIRRDSGPGPKRWVHLGTDDTYISINQMTPAEGRFERHHPGYNHLGFIVKNADALRQRMLAASYEEGFVPDPHPYRKRVYFIDPDGVEYEFVEYLSDDIAQRNDYDL